MSPVGWPIGPWAHVPQKLINFKLNGLHLTVKVWSKSSQKFLSYRADKQTNKQTNKQTELTNILDEDKVFRQVTNKHTNTTHRHTWWKQNFPSSSKQTELINILDENKVFRQVINVNKFASWHLIIYNNSTEFNINMKILATNQKKKNFYEKIFRIVSTKIWTSNLWIIDPTLSLIGHLDNMICIE